jgi:hypothetical protein
MGYFQDKANRIIIDMAIGNLNKISVESGKCRYNFNCHKNAVHEAIKKDMGVVMCLCIGESPMIHFINVTKDGRYIDNTLGIWSQNYDYYLVREIPRDNFFDIDRIFEHYRSHLSSLVPFYISIFADTEY